MCGSGIFPEGVSFSMSLSAFVPNASGTGGEITIYLNGRVIATWNGVSTGGTLVPNGFYHFAVTETLPDGEVVRMIHDAYIETAPGGTVDLVVWPNIARPGDTIQMFASFAGVPADSQSRIKLYAISGELLRTLWVSAGTSSWDLKNNNGQIVVSGLYFAVLDGVDPVSRQKLSKIKKILVLY